MEKLIMISNPITAYFPQIDLYVELDEDTVNVTLRGETIMSNGYLGDEETAQSVVEDVIDTLRGFEHITDCTI